MALLVATAAFVFSACDSGGDGGGVSTPGLNPGTDTLQIGDIQPAPGTDLNTTDTTITVAFTEPIVENDYASDSLDQVSNTAGGEVNLADNIEMIASTAKSSSVQNTIPVKVDFVEERTRLEITPQESLQDGWIYSLDLSGLNDSRIKGEETGATFAGSAPNPEFGSLSSLQYSVGIDEAKPAVPDVVFNDDNPAIASDTELEDDVFNYTDNSITAPLEVLDAADADNVKGYEVYYRSQNEVGGGDGDTFVKAGVASSSSLSSEATPGDFQDWNGIIPASDVADGEFDDGDLEFTATVSSSPFEAADETYGPVEWKFRAVSINGVRSDFTSVVTTPDNEELEYTATASGFSGGDITEVTVNFDEPVQTSTVDAGDFAIEFDGTNNNADVDISVADNGSGDDDGDIIVLDITENTADTDDIDSNDDLTVSGIEDLAGNGIDTDEDQL